MLEGRKIRRSDPRGTLNQRRQFLDHSDAVARGSLARQDYHPADAACRVTL
jgi:hypothetical protein